MNLFGDAYNNILEEYFISGMAFMLFLLLAVFSKRVFPEDDEINKEKNQSLET